jgi:Protein of unknown function (DUF4230)
MKRLCSLLLCTGILFSCGNKKKATQEILALRELSDLTTVEYTVTKMVKANDNKTWFKFGDRKILMSCEAQLKAGIDLSKLAADNISISGKSIRLSLPKAKLISLNLPAEKIQVEYADVGFLRNNFSTADRDALLTQAEGQIRSSVDSLGVLQTAEANATLFISNFLRKLGYEKIDIQFDKRAAPENTLR